jgi:hypothetical protein
MIGHSGKFFVFALSMVCVGVVNCPSSVQLCCGIWKTDKLSMRIKFSYPLPLFDGAMMNKSHFAKKEKKYYSFGFSINRIP